MFDRLFRLTENHTTVRTEILAGITTFLTMAYIIVLQPAILSTDFAGDPTGLDKDAVLLATCVAAALATLIMGLWARYPIGLAPGMGENVFFITVVMALTAKGFENAWQTALAIVFISGAVFLILSIVRLREAVIDAISPSLRSAIAVGIGLFIAMIGLQRSGLIIGQPVTHVTMAKDLATPGLVVFFVGLLVTAVLHVRRVPGAIIIGIVAAAITAAICGKLQIPDQIIGTPQIEHSAVFKLDFRGALTLTALPFIIVFLFMDLFDTVGTLVGVSQAAGLTDASGKLPRANRALLSDAIGTVAGAAMGTSTVTSYVESAAGVEQGGRTGLTAVVVAIGFLLALLFAPIIGLIGGYQPVTATALVIVGAMMMRGAARIDWRDHSEAIPAFLIIIGIPLGYSIADGLALGFVAYPIIKLLTGRAKDVHWLMYPLAALLIAYLIVVRPGIAG